MFITNTIKVLGCITMLGRRASASLRTASSVSARRRIRRLNTAFSRNCLPPDRLVARGNGWIEGTTVGSIILGTVLGGALISPHIAAPILRHHLRAVNTPAEAAMLVIMVIYVIAALFNLRIPDTGARYPKQGTRPIKLVTDFADCFVTLWRDKLGQISLAVTTLFWGAGATLAIHRAEVGGSVARACRFPKPRSCRR